MSNPNLRIVSNNAANAATLTASSTAGLLAVANLLTDIKSQIWRSTGCTSETITVLFPTTQLIGCAILPYCNFTAAATIRVQAYSDAGVTQIYDSGVVNACQYATLGLWNWGSVPLGVNAFPYGGAAYASLWFPIISVKQLLITIADPTNSAGHFDVGRLICGTYWSPSVNASLGASISVNDTSTHNRNDAGDLITTIGTRSRKMSLSLTNMPTTDRASLMSILTGNGMPQPILFSLFPQNTDPVLEQQHMIYGKISTLSPIAVTQQDRYSAPVEFDEV